MKLLFNVLCVTFIAGCASTASNSSLDMQKYVGLPASELVKQLGSAEINYTDDQQTTLSYSPIVTEIPIATTETRVPTGGYGAGAGPVNLSLKSPTLLRKVYADCQVHFSVKNQIVQSWKAQGQDCPASLLNRQVSQP